MILQRLQGIALAGLLAGLMLTACDPSDQNRELETQAEGMLLLDWSMLTPANWDAMKLLEGIDLSQMQDNDPRAFELLKDVRKVWNNAPVVASMNGRRGSLAGYAVPLDQPDQVREFLLVPYFGACIHTPPPPSNQVVHVRMTGPAVSMLGWDGMVIVDGVLAVDYSDTPLAAASYGMAADTVRLFKDTLQSSYP